MLTQILFIVIGLLTMLFESTALHAFEIAGVIPNLTLILIFSCGFVKGPVFGRRLGLVLGLMLDILFSKVIGFYGLLYFLLGHFSGVLAGVVDTGQLYVPALAVFGFDFALGLISWFFLRLLAGGGNFTYYLTGTILPEAVYTTIVMVPLYLLHRFVLLLLERFTTEAADGKEAAQG